MGVIKESTPTHTSVGHLLWGVSNVQTGWKPRAISDTMPQLLVRRYPDVWHLPIPGSLNLTGMIKAVYDLAYKYGCTCDT
jgi:hypothetical protein